MDFEQHYQLAALLFQNALDYHRAFIIQGQEIRYFFMAHKAMKKPILKC
jgi:hypothetical protein